MSGWWGWRQVVLKNERGKRMDALCKVIDHSGLKTGRNLRNL